MDHARVRIVQDGQTLDAHIAHPGPFTAEELLPYRTAREPPGQPDALNRRKIMRKARSKKETADSPGRTRTSLSRITQLLAACRVVVFLAGPR